MDVFGKIDIIVIENVFSEVGEHADGEGGGAGDRAKGVDGVLARDFGDFVV